MSDEVQKICIDPRALQVAILKVRAMIPEEFGRNELTFREYYVARHICDRCVRAVNEALERAVASEKKRNEANA